MVDGQIVDRRRYLRVDAKVITWYQTDAPNGGGETFGALTKNLSGGGLLFETDEPIPLGSRLQVELKIPGEPRVLRSTGRTVRLEAVGGGRYDIGVSFESLPEEDRKAIETYVKGFAPDS